MRIIPRHKGEGKGEKKKKTKRNATRQLKHDEINMNEG
jgi:hypothetical protein